MKFLGLKRFPQEHSTCCIAASASVANYYDPSIDYRHTAKIAKEINFDSNQGLYPGDIGILLNRLGFRSVTIVLCDLDYLDWSWKRLSKKRLIQKIKRQRSIGHTCKMLSNTIVSFLETKGCKNKLIIDFKFGKYIRQYLSHYKPIVIDFNWTLLFESPKVKNEWELHSVAARGYTEKGVSVVDSFYDSSIYPNKTPRYLIPWESLATAMGMSSCVYLPDDFRSQNAQEIG